MRVSWKNGQAEATKVFIECEARNMIEQRGDHDKREGIAEGEAMITGIAPKYAFGFVSQAVAVGNNLKARFHIMKKGEGRSIIQPVPKQRHRFTDDIPRRTKCRTDRGGLRSEGVRSRMVAISGIKAGIEE